MGFDPVVSVPSTLECLLAPPSLDWTGVPWLSAVLASSLTLWAGVGADLKQQGFFIGLSLWLLKMGLGGILPQCVGVCACISLPFAMPRQRRTSGLTGWLLP